MNLFEHHRAQDNIELGAIEGVRLARILKSIFSICLIGVVAYTLLAPLDPSLRPIRLVVTLPLVVLFIAGLALVYRGALRVASLLTVGGLWVALACICAFNGGVHAPSFVAMLIVVLLGGLLFSGRAALTLAAISIVFGALHTLAVGSGLLVLTPISHSDGSWLLAYMVYLILAAQIIALVMDSVRASLTRARAEIAERRIAEAALRASEEKFARAFQAIPVGAVITRVCDSIIIEANDAFMRLRGLAREQVLGQHIDAIGLWTSDDDRRRMRARLMSERSVRDAPFQFHRADGAIGAGLISAEVVEMGGELCILGAISDLSEQLQAAEERRVMEARMLQAQKLESLGLLAGGIAHDFNNLMASVMGNAGLALGGLPAGSALHGNLQAIDQAARSAADLCQQLLVYAGKGKPALSALDLATLVRDMVGLLQLSIERHARVRLNLGVGLPQVIAEASQLRQVVLNLVTNAAEAIAEGGAGGQITINLRLAELDSEALRALDTAGGLAAGAYLVLEVIDDGCGMDAATQRRIFDPFFTTKSGGHGLGLAAVQGIARQHGGTIAVRSAPGAGTTFTLLLPPAPADTAPPAPQAGAGEWAARGAILVVDDEATVRSLARRILERHALGTIEAVDGADAIAVFARHADEIAAVLLDLTMPNMGGVEVLAALRRMRADLPVLLTSGYSELIEDGGLPQDPRIGFIQKPYRPQELIEKLRTLLVEREV